MQPRRYPTMLSIAGSDSIGGAGVQADVKTATLLGVYAMTAITAVTAQNSCGVRQSLSLPDELIRAQLDAVFDELRPGAVKTGMIPSATSARTIADTLEARRVRNLVVDPVLVSSSGHTLCGALESYIATATQHLFPLAALVTPNIPETAAILGISPEEVAARPEASARRFLSQCGCSAVLIKGGHRAGDKAADLLYTGSNIHIFESPRILTRNDHGTGCTLSAAIASFLALGEPIADAVANAKKFLSRGLELGRDFRLSDTDEQAGHGPLYLLPDNPLQL